MAILACLHRARGLRRRKRVRLCGLPSPKTMLFRDLWSLQRVHSPRSSGFSAACLRQFVNGLKQRGACGRSGKRSGFRRRRGNARICESGGFGSRFLAINIPPNRIGRKLWTAEGARSKGRAAVVVEKTDAEIVVKAQTLVDFILKSFGDARGHGTHHTGECWAARKLRKRNTSSRMRCATSLLVSFGSGNLGRRGRRA